MSVGYTLPARDPEHGFLFPAPGVRDERYIEVTGASPQHIKTRLRACCCRLDVMT